MLQPEIDYYAPTHRRDIDQAERTNPDWYEGLTVACDHPENRTHHFCAGCQCACHIIEDPRSLALPRTYGAACRLNNPGLYPDHYADTHGRHRPLWNPGTAFVGCLIDV